MDTGIKQKVKSGLLTKEGALKVIEGWTRKSPWDKDKHYKLSKWVKRAQVK